MKIEYGIAPPNPIDEQIDYATIKPGGSVWSKCRDDALSTAKAFNAWALKTGSVMFSRVTIARSDDPEGAGWRAWFEVKPTDRDVVLIVDPVRVWMEACIMPGISRHRSSRLYESFERWAKERFPASEVPHINFFTRALKEYGVEFKRRTDGWYGMNIEVREPAFHVPILSMLENPFAGMEAPQTDAEDESAPCALCETLTPADELDEDGTCQSCAAEEPEPYDPSDPDAALRAKLETKRRAR